MHATLRVVTVAALALALHLTLGWMWTLAAGVVSGAWVVHRGWFVGALGVAGGWAALVAYNYAVAGGAIRAMTETMGGILGNMPGAVVVAATVLIGGLIGLVGGLLGTTLRGLFGR